MSDAAIMELNLPTGIPIVYELDKDLKPIKPMQFLGDEETVRKAMEAVAAQGKVKKWRADTTQRLKYLKERGALLDPSLFEEHQMNESEHMTWTGLSHLPPNILTFHHHL